MDVLNSPYADFLEDIIEHIMDLQPVKIGICTLSSDGSTLTGYYGGCDHQDKALMAHQIYSDSILDIVKANAGIILEAADEEEDDEG